MKYSTEQEAFWKGSFGDEYAERNRGAGWVAANTAFFSNVPKFPQDDLTWFLMEKK